MATLQFSERRSLIRSGLDGSNTSAARIACGAPCASSYSLMSGTGSMPTTDAMLRMCPRV